MSQKKTKLNSKKIHVDKTGQDLAETLGLEPSVVVEWEVRQSLVSQIEKVFEKQEPTVSEVSKRAGTSRARVTQVLKGDATGISVDVLLRILGALGQTVKISYKKAA